MITNKGISATGHQLLESIVPLQKGSRLKEYEVLGVVGEGGFGVVYRGADGRLDREVAIKEFLPSMWASRRDDGHVVCRSDKHKLVFEAALAGFINEARLLARFKHHSLVQVLHFWEQNGTAYMVMPLYKGLTLKQLVNQNVESITQVRLLEIIKALMGALEVLHLESCYHRDLSPDNVILLEDGSPILLDFGAARRSADDVDQTFTVILKPGYAPVEQYANDSSIQQGPWTDIYGLAALCYFIITKRTPITSVTRLMRDQLVPLAEQNISGFDSKFLKLIDWGMAVKPEARPQSISEYRDQFSSLEGKVLLFTESIDKPEVEKNIVTNQVEIKTQDAAKFLTEYSDLKPCDEVVLPVIARPIKQSKHGLKYRKIIVFIFAFLLAVLLGLVVRYSAKNADIPVVVSNPPNISRPEAYKPLTTSIAEQIKQPQAPSVEDSLAPKETIVAPVGSLNTAFPKVPMANISDSGAVGPVKPINLQGFAQINVIPWGKVFIDGTYIGVTPPLRRIPLGIGVHKITIRNEGFADAFRSVTVKQGQTIIIKHEFN
jgi:serine/threonine protein kinase